MQKFKKLSTHAKLLAVTMSLTLTGCATTTGFGVTTKAPFCSVAKPIFWSIGDTDKTIAQVKEHNAVGRELCHW